MHKIIVLPETKNIKQIMTLPLLFIITVKFWSHIEGIMGWVGKFHFLTRFPQLFACAHNKTLVGYSNKFPHASRVPLHSY